MHGFTEFQVNGGAAGALIVEGMNKVRPEVGGLTERVFVIRQQYLVPWVPGPYQLTINYLAGRENCTILMTHFQLFAVATGDGFLGNIGQYKQVNRRHVPRPHY